jgi:hypothetical protein
MHPVERYLAELRDIRASGAAVPETSGYGALSNLLNEVGGKLKPKVRCFINLTNAGAGIPDGGLFTANQIPKGAREPAVGLMPARGAIEVKPVEQNAAAVARTAVDGPPGAQLRRYLEKYRQVLVTTYREFVLVGCDLDGEPTELERFSLAATEAEFWALAAHPGSVAARAAGERLTDFLRRAMLRPAPIVSPQDLAWFLASYAREALARVEAGGERLPALRNTRSALEEALGMTFSGEKGEHFFRSTLVQTLFYGLFSAWVDWAGHHPPAEQAAPASTATAAARSTASTATAAAPTATAAATSAAAPQPAARFRWKEAAGHLHIPILQRLFYDFAMPSSLDVLRLDEVLDWAGEALNRVDRASFFATFARDHAVQYFYEPFLEAFDPQLRKELGVWYTPPEIVQYMVARVDTVLREELEIADGLADPRVVVLDPCCGTGAYLVEVLRRIAQTLQEKGGDALVANDLKRAAIERVFGFEILPAPFVISHLQVGLALKDFGAPFAEQSDERAGVYLTNALTGWDPPKEPKQHLLFHEMEEERDKAAAVKQHAPILVILGNPPYNGFAGVSPEEEGGLVDAYKTGLASDWRITKNYLDDLYVRFYRIAERRIGTDPRGGVVSYVTNLSWLADPSAVVMRQMLLNEFDTIFIDCLNGDSRETGKRTADGRPDPSVFSTRSNPAGIQVGTAIAQLIRRPSRATVEGATVHHRDFWGTAKLRALAQDSDGTRRSAYSTLHPTCDNRYAYRPVQTWAGYRDWPSIRQLSAERWLLGLNENRSGALVNADYDVLLQRMRTYLDSSIPLASLPPDLDGLARPWARFDPIDTRNRMIKHSPFNHTRLRRYLAKPFDLQWAYVDTTRKLWNEPRAQLVTQASHGCSFMLARARAPRSLDGSPFTVSKALADQHSLHKDAYLLPLELRAGAHPDGAQPPLFETIGERSANISDLAWQYLKRLRACEPAAVWLHVLSVGYSPSYLHENADGIRHDWPRIPLPAKREDLLASAELGRQVAALLDVEEPVDGVSTGSIRHELRIIGPITAADAGRQLDPGAGHLAVTAGWGHAGKGGITMPGRGRLIERPYTLAEQALLREGAGSLSMTYDQLLTCLGETCHDVYLNDHAYWSCVPARVWKYTIGGYQVMKKWLSYRERPLLGRDLKPDEARYVTEMARRIAAILLLEPALDENYERVKADTYAWPGVSAQQ